VKLTNGATILRAYINYEHDDAVVLAKFRDDELFTWNSYRRDGDEEWHCEIGHYFAEHDRAEAIEDFHTRAARRGLMP
jgi:hypothetical protein